MLLARGADEVERQYLAAWLRPERSSGRECRFGAISIRARCPKLRSYLAGLLLLSLFLLFFVLRTASSRTSVNHTPASWASAPLSPPRSLSNCQKGAL